MGAARRLEELGDDHGADAGALATAMVAKRRVVVDAIDVVNTAMDTVGRPGLPAQLAAGAGLPGRPRRPLPPLAPEVTLTFAGRLALGLDTNSE